MKQQILIFFIVIFFPFYSFSQTQPRPEWTKGNQPDFNVSISETVEIGKALQLINEVSFKTIGKVIVDHSEKTNAIGIEIINTHWRKALEMICKKNELEFEEGPNFIRVYNPLTKKTEGLEKVDLIGVDTREVIIEAIFFEADRSALRELGINWSTISSGVVNTSAVQQTAENVSDNNIFTLSIQRQIDRSLSVSGLVKTFENKGLGHVLSNPQIRVRDKQEGYVQVGQDFSIKTRDFAGNTIESFVSAGTILRVQPTVIVDKGVTFILLKINVERSTGDVSQLTTTINKSQASTSLLMLPGEEAAIGGLYTTEKRTTRKGIPFLKDLPWWVLGIRYIAGYERELVNQKELVIMLKVDLEPDLRTRMEQRLMEQRLDTEKAKREQRLRNLEKQVEE
ncbi:MAG: type II and III secretion system protein [bacterium]|nr:type II and III secretion system protein [bacterium]